MWLLQRLAVDARSWWPIVTSQLASGRVRARRARAARRRPARCSTAMLVQAGISASLAGIGIGVASIVAARHARRAAGARAPRRVLLGVAIPTRLRQAALVGIALFVAAARARRDAAGLRPAVLGVGRLWIRDRDAAAPRPAAAGGPAGALRDQRDLVRRALGARWWEAVAGAAGRWLFDWLTLLTALAAVGQHPRPTLVLLAFCAAQLLAQIPITPGGLGVVEAGLTGTLV